MFRPENKCTLILWFSGPIHFIDRQNVSFNVPKIFWIFSFVSHSRFNGEQQREKNSRNGKKYDFETFSFLFFFFALFRSLECPATWFWTTDDGIATYTWLWIVSHTNRPKSAQIYAKRFVKSYVSLKQQNFDRLAVFLTTLYSVRVNTYIRYAMVETKHRQNGNE